MAIKFKKLKEEVEIDLSWTMANCSEVSMRLPKLRSKYCAYLFEIELSVKHKEMVMDAVYKDLLEHYATGNASNVLIDRRDIPLYIRGEDAYIKVVADYELEKGNAKYIEGILKALDSMSFSINSAIKWEMYQGGA